MARILEIPGMVDVHTHLRDLDWRHKASFASETEAALAGGFWAVFDMPNTPPETTNRPALDRKLQAFQAQALCDWGVYYGASPAGTAEDLAACLPDCVGMKIYNNETTGQLLIQDPAIRERWYRDFPADRVIALHAEDGTAAELLTLVRKYRRPTHLCHVCTAYEVQLMREAKAEGLPVTFGICPHHLFLTAADEARLGSHARMKPPLKTAADQAALWEAIADGTADAIESDHAPHTLAEKAGPQPPYGVPGLATTLPLMATALAEGRLGPRGADRLIELLATGPQRIFGLSVPEGTVTRVDLDAGWVLRGAELPGACGWTPFEGMAVQGRVLETWIRGEKAWSLEDGLRVAPGFGRRLAVGRPGALAA